MYRTMRIAEPFVKVHFALWLASKGANEITVSVDGAEPSPHTVFDVLKAHGYSHMPAPRSIAKWTGQYAAPGRRIVVVSRPGFDIQAVFPDGKRCVAECKGEPTPKAVQAGLDLTSFYTGLGQLIIALGSLDPMPEWKILALPKTQRLVQIADRASGNSLLRQLDIQIVLVDGNGGVKELGEPMQRLG